MSNVFAGLLFLGELKSDEALLTDPPRTRKKRKNSLQSCFASLPRRFNGNSRMISSQQKAASKQPKSKTTTE